MLYRSFKNTLPASERLAQFKLELSPLTNSALAELVKLSTPPAQFIGNTLVTATPEQSEQNIAEFGMMLESISSDEATMWGSSYDSTVDTVAKVIKPQISYIRNTIKPTLVEFTNKVVNYARDLGTDDPTYGLVINKIAIPKICKEPEFLNLLSEFKGFKVLEPGYKGKESNGLNLRFLQKPSDLTEFVKTGIYGLDEAIQEWALNNPVLETVFYSFIADYSHESERSKDAEPLLTRSIFGSFGTDLGKRLNVAIAYFLMTRYCCHCDELNIVVSRQSGALSQMKENNQQHLSFSAGMLISALSELETKIKNNQIVSKIEKEKGTIHVFEETYETWISEGGSVETILGVLVSNSNTYTSSAIDAQSDKLISEWSKYTQAHLNNLRYKKVNSLMDYYYNQLRIYFEQDYVDTVEGTYLNNHPGYVDAALIKARSYLGRMNRDELLDVVKVCKYLVLSCKYGWSYAEVFIEDMERAAKDNPKIDAKEAAFIAEFNYIVDFICGQITARVIK